VLLAAAEACYQRMALEMIPYRPHENACPDTMDYRHLTQPCQCRMVQKRFDSRQSIIDT